MSVTEDSGAWSTTEIQSQENTLLRFEDVLIEMLLRVTGQPSVAVTTWTGRRHGPDDAEFHLIIHSRRALLRIALDPDRYFGDEYSTGTVTLEGSLRDFLEHIMGRRQRAGRDTALQRTIQSLRRARANTLTGSLDNIRHHYDLGNDFYETWLDHEMVYTCAVFESPEMSLEEAQRAKMDLVCRKLALKPGQRVIEAGCGWGSLARHMARYYGVTVEAYNISAEQVAYARQRAEQEGLADRVTFVQDDYRNIRGTCDAFVSVGMLEHVGVEHYESLGRVINETLSPNGIGLIHSIGQNLGRPMNSWIERHIFPGAYPPTLAEMTNIFRPFNFTVLDVENLRLHYARTLEHWLERYEESLERVVARFDDTFARAWRFYLTGSIATFMTGRLQLFQVVFSRHDNNHIPWTRHHMLSRPTDE